MKKYHYVYKLYNDYNETYFGMRSSKKPPSQDSYRGSFKTWEVDKDTLNKEILKQFDDRLSAQKYEAKIIKENFDEENNRNFHIPFESGKEYNEKRKIKIEKYNKNKNKNQLIDKYKKKIEWHTQQLNKWKDKLQKIES